MIAARNALLALAPIVCGALADAPAVASATTASQSSWPEVKCARYTEAWREALARRGARGLGSEFLASHEAFLAAGCTGPANVCPRSPEELELANIMVVAAMNAGTASTFLPFACRPEPGRQR